MKKLSDRLEAAMAMITPGSAVLDIGCDHAYTSIELVNRKTVPLALASDVRPGPLKNAADHIREAGLSEQIRTELCDGVPEDYRAFTGNMPVTALILGMGGKLIRKILDDAYEKGLCFEETVVSPQRDVEEVRWWLADHGFQITEEKFLLEDGKYYTLIKAEQTWQAIRLREEEASYGPLLLEEKQPLLHDYLNDRLSSLEELCGHVTKNTDAGKKRLSELRTEITKIKNALMYF